MALRKIAMAAGAEPNYLKITSVTAATETGVIVTTEQGNQAVNRITTVVAWNIYKNAESRWNGTGEFETIKNGSMGFAEFPNLPEGWTGTDYQKLIAVGYQLLRTLPEFSMMEWEDC